MEGAQLVNFSLTGSQNQGSYSQVFTALELYDIHESGLKSVYFYVRAALIWTGRNMPCFIFVSRNPPHSTSTTSTTSNWCTFLAGAFPKKCAIINPAELFIQIPVTIILTNKTQTIKEFWSLTENLKNVQHSHLSAISCPSS